MHITFVDETTAWQNLKPLTYTKPISELRVGILTIREKWCKRLECAQYSYSTTSYLQEKYPASIETSLFINAAFLPNHEIIALVKSLDENQALVSGENWIAFKGSDFDDFHKSSKKSTSNVVQLSQLWNLIKINAQEINLDFELLTSERNSAPIDDQFTATYNSESIFLEEGARVKAAVLNAVDGPIYIGKNAKVNEGSIIRGPFALCENAQIALGAKIREGCTVGIKAVAGGEIKNSIIGDYSNKGHDGYLGDSILGSWCNLGALTNVSNLKNTYSEILIDTADQKKVATGTNKLGCILGDYVHTGISTVLNTGTIVDPFCQLYGTGLHSKYLPSFQWGQAHNYERYQLEKALGVAEKIYVAKNEAFSKVDQNIITYLYNNTVS